MKQSMAVLTSNASDEWYTPPWLIEAARTVLGTIDLDPASNSVAQAYIRATTYYWENGLALPWLGNVWLNSPFSDTKSWVKKFMTADITAGICLTNSAPGYNWWEEAVDGMPAVMLRKRVRFLYGPELLDRGQAKKGQTVFYRGPNPDRFYNMFDSIGRTVN